MTITFDKFDPTQETPTFTTTAATTKYTPTDAATGAKTIIDITGNKVTDNEAYKGQGLTKDDIMQQAANTDPALQKNFMVVMSNCVSGEDFEKMSEEGFNLGSCDPETYVTTLDRIKATLASAGVEVEGYTDTLDTKTLEAITGAVTQALEIQATQSDVGENITKYLVENNLSPTIENVYKAGYSATDAMVQAQGYYSDGAYYAKKADEIDLDALNDSINQAVTRAGFSEDEQDAAVEAAKWLVEAGIELNTDNLLNAYNIRTIDFPLDKDEVTKLCITAVMNGKSPYQADLSGEKPIAQQAGELLEEVENITDEQLHAAVEKGVELNIKNIANMDTEESDIEGKSTDQTPTLKELQARLQMEEIRLSMTQEANLRLLRQGISIDTTKLSDLVEMLRKATQDIKQALYQGNSVEENQNLEGLYNETITKTDEIALLPAAVLGPIAAEIGSVSFEDIYDKKSDYVDLTRTGEYEKLMTAPRGDLGDSITKAFRNVDDILTDMGLETSASNRRAVRILGYNSMEITDENIERVKQADSQVNECLDKMTPSTVLKMIREQKNPLDMSMDELKEYLDKNSDGSIEESEKYSRFLQKLDRAGDITSDEREAYIGIYRLFNQIERSDGAVIGSIVATGAQMNFKNMLAAVRTNRDKDIDITIDDGFGALSELIMGKKSIDAQINSGFANGNDYNHDSSQADSENERRQEQYYADLSGRINTELSDKTDVSKLGGLDITPQTTIEGFSDMLEGIEVDKQAQSELQNEAYEAYRESLNTAMQAEQSVIDELTDYSQPITTYNLEAALLMNEDKNGLFRKLADTEGDIFDKAEEFIENLEASDSASDLYEEVIKAAREEITSNIFEAGTSRIDIKAAQGMFKELSLLGGLSREENYQVPMKLAGEVTNVNLKIYHNKEQQGKVAITLENNTIGKLAAEFCVDSDKITGMVAYSDKAVAEMLGGISKNLSQAFGDKKANISLAQSDTINLSRFGNDRDNSTARVGDVVTGDASTGELYKTAKIFLKSLKQLEE